MSHSVFKAWCIVLVVYFDICKEFNKKFIINDEWHTHSSKFTWHLRKYGYNVIGIYIFMGLTNHAAGTE